MIIEIFGDGIDRKSINKSKHKVTCRSVVISENKILIVHFQKTNHYNLPGGGLENQESLVDCCIRETKEETGYDISIIAPTVTIMEYYPDSTWETHYFKAVLNNHDKSSTKPTLEEQEAEMTTRWIDIYEFLDILESAPTNHINGQNIHERELIGLMNSL